MDATRGYSKMLNEIRAQPPAGSRVGSGKFPHSFDYSGGKCLQDSYFQKNTTHPKKYGGIDGYDNKLYHDYGQEYR